MKAIVLEDNQTYVIVKEMTIDNTLYTLFANINNEQDICFRKTLIENGEEYFVGLDDEKEAEKVLSYFSKDILEKMKNSD